MLPCRNAYKPSYNLSTQELNVTSLLQPQIASISFFFFFSSLSFALPVVSSTEFQDPLCHKVGDNIAIPQHAHKVDKFKIGRFCRKLLTDLIKI
jgi:hypothetical protein